MAEPFQTTVVHFFLQMSWKKLIFTSVCKQELWSGIPPLTLKWSNHYLIWILTTFRAILKDNATAYDCLDQMKKYDCIYRFWETTFKFSQVALRQDEWYILSVFFYKH